MPSIGETNAGGAAEGYLPLKMGGLAECDAGRSSHQNSQ
jgi:hypothetical protein